MFHQRPAFLGKYPYPSRYGHDSNFYKSHTLSKGVSSIEECFLLDIISPEIGYLHSLKHPQRKQNTCFQRLVEFTMGLAAVLFMYSVLVVFYEVVGMVIEICVFTFMGTIVNAGSAAKYIMLAFWVLMYCSTCYNNMYDKYLSLNKKIFEFIKSKLKEEISQVTILPHILQKNTAFKYFTNEEIKTYRDIEMRLNIDTAGDKAHSERHLVDAIAHSERHLVDAEQAENTITDIIDNIDEQLYWKVSSLVFFIDKLDEPRIPKSLFRQICNITAPGCPGPLYKGLLMATRQLLYMVIFLLFVIAVVLAFGNANQVSTTNQMLMTLAGGFIPFVVRFVMKPAKDEINLNSYSFEGKVHQIIRDFHQVWPVFDLSYAVANATNEVKYESEIVEDENNINDSKGIGLAPEELNAVAMSISAVTSQSGEGEMVQCSEINNSLSRDVDNPQSKLDTDVLPLEMPITVNVEADKGETWTETI